MRCLFAAVAICACGLASADLGVYTATLDGSQEVPLVVTGGSGTASFTFESGTGQLGGSMSASGLIYTITGAHIHAGAVGVEGPILVDLGLPAIVDGSFVWDISETLSGNIGPDLLSNEQFKALLDSGGAYLNIHSELYPDGEIRGQVQVVPEPASMAILAVGSAALMLRRRPRL